MGDRREGEALIHGDVPSESQGNLRCRKPALVAFLFLTALGCVALIFGTHRNRAPLRLANLATQESILLDSVAPTLAAAALTPTLAPVALTPEELDANEKTEKLCACVRPKFARSCSRTYSVAFRQAEDNLLRCVEDPTNHKPWCYVKNTACASSQRSQVKSLCRWRYADDDECSIPAGPLSNMEVGSYKRQVASCVLDVHQLTMALAYAGLGIYYAIGKDQSSEVLAINVMAVLSSFTWATSFIAGISSSCMIGIDNRRAFCASDIAWFFGDLYQVAIDGMAINQACVKDQAPKLPHLNISEAFKTLRSLAPEDAVKRLPSRPLDGVRRKAAQERHANQTGGRRMMGIPRAINRIGNRGHGSSIKDKIEDLPGRIQERKVDIAACVFDVQEALSYLARVGLLLSAIPASSCVDPDPSEPEKKECAVNMINVFDWVAWTAEYFTLVAGSCPVRGATGSSCAAPIIDIIASSTSLVVAGDGMAKECKHAQYEHPVYPTEKPN